MISEWSEVTARGETYFSPARLRLLVELERLGTMSAVSDECGLATSAISQHLKVLEREAGTQLLEADGRRVRLTPAGRLLAERAHGILAGLDAARAELAIDAEPKGVVRLAATQSMLRERIFPWLAEFQQSYPAVELDVIEAEPVEMRQLLLRKEIDLATLYDFNLAPLEAVKGLDSHPLHQTPWSILVPGEVAAVLDQSSRETIMRGLAKQPWIVNSRGPEDGEVIRHLAASVAQRPRVRHRVDALDLVEDLVSLGLGVALHPVTRPVGSGAVLLDPGVLGVRQRFHAVCAPGWERWPAGRAVLTILKAAARSGMPDRID